MCETSGADDTGLLIILKQTDGQERRRGFHRDSAVTTLESMSFHVPRPAQIELLPDNTQWMKVGQV